MAGYSRQSLADIISGAVIKAAPVNAEFNAIRDSFAFSGGHKHDGSSTEGAYIPLIADVDGKNKVVVDTTNNRISFYSEVSGAAVEQVRIQDGKIVPVTDDDIDLGAVGAEFKDLYIDGIGYIDSVVITGGTIDGTTIGATTPAAADFTTMDTTGNATVGGTLVVTGLSTLATADINGGNIDGTTIGAATRAAGNFTTVSTSGQATLASADINGGTVDNTVIGSTTAAAITGTNITATSGLTGNLTGNVTGAVTGNVTGNLTGNVTSSGASTFANADINGGSIDGTPIGTAAASTVRGTTVTATTGFVGNVTGNVTGNTTGTHTGNVTSASGTSTFNNLTVNGSVDVTNATVQNVASPTIGTDAANKSYVDAQIAATIDAAPGTLDTLNELAAALGDDPNFATTVTNSIATKVSKSGDSMAGNLSMSGNKVTGLADPTTGTDAVTKNYVDTVYGSVSSAAASATAAAASATSAEDDRILVQSVYDTFDDRYLGAKASDPTLDNDGNALLTGALYFDNTNNITKVYNGTEWQAASSSIEGIKSSFLYTASASQTVFSGADANGSTLVIDKAGLVNVFLNGVRIIQDSDYTINASTDVVTLTTGAAAGDTLEVEVFGNFAGQSGADVAITGGLIDGTVIGGTTPAAGNFTTGSFTGDVSFGDNDKAIFGAGSDLQIYSNGANSFISESGSGSLFIDGDNISIRSAVSGNYAKFLSNGAAEIYFNGVKKLSTTATGIDVTGTVTADKLAVSGTGVVASFERTDADTLIELKRSGSVQGYIGSNTSGDVRFYNSAAAKKLQLSSNGDISFFEDTGTTPKFHWSASDESLGIGTSSPQSNTSIHIVGTDGASGASANVAANELFVDNAGDTGVTIGSANTGTGYYAFADSDVALRGGIFYDHSTDDMGFRVASATRMTIDNGGNVGIGTSSPNTGRRLHVFDTGDAILRVETATAAGDGRLELIGSSSGVSQIRFGDEDLVNIGLLTYTHSENSMAFNTNSSERMRIDSSGNVGIGTSSPDKPLHILSTTPDQIVLEANSTTIGPNIIFKNTDGNLARIATAETNTLRFEVGPSNTEAARIDASGNLLVGKDITNLYENGFAALSDGQVLCTADSTIPLQVRLNTGSGDVIKLWKDAASFGSLGVAGGDLYIGNGGIAARFDNSLNAITPFNNNTELNSDGVMNLGDENRRFKDLYLSGGVYLGGTGAANKLDDYEEGQWEVVITGETSGSVSTGVNGNYVKVGNMVTAAVYVNTTLDLTSISGVVNISLPMAALNWHGGGSLVYANNFLAGTAEADTYIGLRPLDARVRMMKGSSTSWLSHTDIETASGSKAFMLHVTFQV